MTDRKVDQQPTAAPSNQCACGHAAEDHRIVQERAICNVSPCHCMDFQVAGMEHIRVDPLVIEGHEVAEIERGLGDPAGTYLKYKGQVWINDNWLDLVRVRALRDWLTTVLERSADRSSTHETKKEPVAWRAWVPARGEWHYTEVKPATTALDWVPLYSRSAVETPDHAFYTDEKDGSDICDICGKGRAAHAIAQRSEKWCKCGEYLKFTPHICFTDSPVKASPEPHPNGRCKCLYCGEGFVMWGDCSVHERSCSKNPAFAQNGRENDASK